MDGDDIFKAFAMFQDGVKSLQLQRSLSQANEAVQQIKGSELAETEQMQAIRGVANELTLRLVGSQTPAATIDQVRKAFEPPQPTQFQQNLALEGFRQQGQDRRTAASQQFQHNENELNRQNAVRVASTAKPKPDGGAKLEIGAINELQKLDTSLVAGKSLMESIDGYAKSFPGIQNMSQLETNIRARFNPQFQGFKTELGMYIDAYRKSITGMSATEGELKIIESRLPSLDMNPKQFKAALNTIMKVGNQVRARYLDNLKRGGRDVSGFMKPGSQAVAADPETAAQHLQAASVSEANQIQVDNTPAKYFR